MTTAVRARAERLDLLLIVRGLAAVSVVVWHTEGYKALYPAVLNTSGRVAVWLFFGISGYVIAYGFVHGRYRLVPSELSYFYRNRFLRIYPLFFVLTMLAWATVWWTTGRNPMTLAEVPAQLFAVQWNQTYKLLGVFWTLGVELQFYLFAPLLALPIVARGRWSLALSIVGYAALIGWCQYAVNQLAWSWDGRNIVLNLPHFFAGMIACRVVRDVDRPSGPTVAACLSVAAVLLGYTNWLYHRRPGDFWSLRAIVLADAIIVLLVIAHAYASQRSRPPGRVLAALSFLGVLSYGVYAWHGYIITYVPWTANRMIVLILLSIAVAFGSYRLIERPALARKKHPTDNAPLASQPRPVAAC